MKFPGKNDEIVEEVRQAGACALYGSTLRDLFPQEVGLQQFCANNELMVSMALGMNGVGSDVFVFTRDFRAT
jgi:hypothetical protein